MANVMPALKDVVAIDYETFYDSNDGYSMKNMTAYQYVHDRRFNAYLVAVAFGDGRKSFVGHPGEFDWESIKGMTCLAHNARFDSNVTYRLQELGKIPKDVATEWLDTADMVAYLGVQRSLKNAMKVLLGREISKAVRSNMDGKLPIHLSTQELHDLYEYGAGDAEECLELWTKFSDQWPEIERKISRQNRVACDRGFHVDRGAVAAGLDILRGIQSEAASKLPWVNCQDPAARKPAGSLPALAEAVRLAGVEPPPTFKKDAPEFLEWNEKHADEFPFLKARLEHAGTVQHIARLETLLDQLDENDIVRPGFVYFGAHSGRFAAGLGEDQQGAKNVNMLNLPRKPVFGVDMRGMYTARPGYKYVIFDYSQIEARTLLWIAGDMESCDVLRDPNANFYEMIAAQQGWCKVGDGIKHKKGCEQMYRVAKAEGLGLGYGMSGWKFVQYCKGMGIDLESWPREKWEPLLNRRSLFMLKNVCKLDPSSEHDQYKIGQYFYSQSLVDAYRNANPKIASRGRDPETNRAQGLWQQLEDIFVAAANAHESKVEYTLPSGRTKTYWNPHYTMTVEIVTNPETGKKENSKRRTLTATVVRGQTPKYFNGGKITENLIQALCRDIMTYGAVEIEDKHPTWKFCWSCYDETIFEVPEAEVGEAVKEIPDIMCHGDYIKGWTKGLPLAVDGEATDKYMK